MDQASTSEGLQFDVCIQKPKVKITHVNGLFYVSRNDADYLETEARVCVNRTVPNEKGWFHNSNLCQIMAELVIFLCEFGIAQVVKIDAPEDPIPFQEIDFPDSVEFRARRLTARDMWKRGFFLADGSRFGGDFLAYIKTPNEAHAEFVVLCSNGNESDEKSRIAAMRCCNQVKKNLLIAKNFENLVPHYTECKWFRPEFF